jgi:serine/threonine protein kinase
MPLSSGDKLGPYEVLASIGVGGMGEVWKARDTRLNRFVAIKQLAERYGAPVEQEVGIAVFDPSRPLKKGTDHSVHGHSATSSQKRTGGTEQSLS